MADLNNEVPDGFWRGVSDPNVIQDGYYISAGAFKFDAYNPSRGDGYCEMSVNWDDGIDALHFLMHQRKERSNEPQFKVGAIKVQRSGYESFLSKYINEGKLKCERREIAAFLIDKEEPVNNIFHGNILVKHSSENSQNAELKVLKLQVGTALATAATQLSQIVLLKDYDSSKDKANNG